MIIDHTFFSHSFDGILNDTAIPTSEIDEVTLGAGLYDELFVSVDTTIDDTNMPPTKWEIKTIMDAKFQNSVEAGTIDGSGHIVTTIQVYRREYQKTNEKWLLISQFPYEKAYNMYTIIDRFAENNKVYEYAIVPLANEIMGDVTISQPISVTFNGAFISDTNTNYAMDFDFKMGDITHNKNTSTQIPLNGAYPIVSFGAQNYRSGSVQFLPLAPETANGNSNNINTSNERLNREAIIKFLNNGQSKVIRKDDGTVIVVATTNVKESNKSDSIDGLNTLSFDFIEIGELDFETMDKTGLIGGAGKSVYTYDEFGNVTWDNERVNDDARRKYRNSFAVNKTDKNKAV